MTYPEVGSPLWNRLLMALEGRCVECQRWTDHRNYDNDAWVCEDCDAALAAEQEREDRLNDPRHGQAEAINRGY